MTTGVTAGLHEFHVVVFGRVDVGELPGGENAAEIGHLLLDAADRLVAQVAQDAVRRDVVVPVVGRVGHLDLNAQIGQLRLDDFGDVDHLVVFETEIENVPPDQTQ